MSDLKGSNKNLLYKVTNQLNVYFLTRFLVSANQKQELPIVAVCFAKSRQNEGSERGITKIV